MSSLLQNARRSGLRQQEAFSRRWEPKRPKDWRGSRKHGKRGKR